MVLCLSNKDAEAMEFPKTKGKNPQSLPYIIYKHVVGLNVKHYTTKCLETNVKDFITQVWAKYF